MRSVFVVVLFWWSATGVIFALERGQATRTVGLVLASLLAVWGLWLVFVERDRESPSAVRRGFIGAAFLWTWVQVLFYGGWLVGPASLAVAVPAEPPSWSLAVRAVKAMLWYQLAMLLVLGAVAWSVAARPNRIGWWALLTFWLSHQAASINIFLGVENPGRGFFPEGRHVPRVVLRPAAQFVAAAGERGRAAGRSRCGSRCMRSAMPRPCGARP